MPQNREKCTFRPRNGHKNNDYFLVQKILYRIAIMSILVERTARNVVTILINRPDRRNALNLTLIKSLRNALDEFEHDDKSNVAILGGLGGNFCSGLDLTEVIDPDTGLPNVKHVEEMLWPTGSRLSKKKITIAAIEGYAAGFGYELALKCDFRVAESDARLGFLNRRFGIPIMNGGTVILPKLVGKGRAMELIATGKAQLASEAQDYGVLSYISDVGCSLGRSLSLARSLAKFNQAALLLDLKANVSSERHELESLRQERERALNYLRNCGPMETAVRFLRGELCRHGKFNLDNNVSSDVDVTVC